MTDWNLIANIAGSTWGITILVCAIAWLVAWVVGLMIQRIKVKDKEVPAKEK